MSPGKRRSWTIRANGSASLIRRRARSAMRRFSSACSGPAVDLTPLLSGDGVRDVGIEGFKLRAVRVHGRLPSRGWADLSSRLPRRTAIRCRASRWCSISVASHAAPRSWSKRFLHASRGREARNGRAAGRPLAWKPVCWPAPCFIRLRRTSLIGRERPDLRGVGGTVVSTSFDETKEAAIREALAAGAAAGAPEAPPT